MVGGAMEGKSTRSATRREEEEEERQIRLMKTEKRRRRRRRRRKKKKESVGLPKNEPHASQQVLLANTHTHTHLTPDSP